MLLLPAPFQSPETALPSHCRFDGLIGEDLPHLCVCLPACCLPAGAALPPHLPPSCGRSGCRVMLASRDCPLLHSFLLRASSTEHAIGSTEQIACACDVPAREFGQWSVSIKARLPRLDFLKLFSLFFLVVDDLDLARETPGSVTRIRWVIKKT